MSDLLQNEFFKGGIGVALVGALVVLLRRLPMQLWVVAVRQLTVTVTVNNDSPLFLRLIEWLDAQGSVSDVHSVIATASYLEKDGRVLYSPAAGSSLLRILGRYVRVTRQRKEVTMNTAYHVGMHTDVKSAESISFQYIGRSHKFGRSIVMAALEHYEADRRKQQEICNPIPVMWKCSRRPVRLLSSVVMPSGLTESLAKDMSEFFLLGELYKKLCIPYHRTYLFYGSPGSGKTSMIAALAGHLGLAIYNWSLRLDKNCQQLIDDVPSGSILVIEDIDAFFNGRERLAQAEFSDLLNIIDGFKSREQAIIILTTNHIDKLDPALMRRANVKVEFGPASEEQASAMFLRFFPNEIESSQRFASLAAGAKMSECQDWLFDNRSNLKVAEVFPRRVV